jgi:hypothetical protein
MKGFEGDDMHKSTNGVVSIFYQLVTLHIQNGGAIKKALQADHIWQIQHHKFIKADGCTRTKKLDMAFSPHISS